MMLNSKDAFTFLGVNITMMNKKVMKSLSEVTSFLDTITRKIKKCNFDGYYIGHEYFSEEKLINIFEGLTDLCNALDIKYEKEDDNNV